MLWLPLILIVPYLYLTLKIFLNLRRAIPFRSSSDPEVYVSVIIACRNEQTRLPTLLRCLSEQSYPREFREIIIVDDNSSDQTVDYVASHNIDNHITLLRNKGTGKKAALLTGIGEARGRLIMTTDADCTMGKDWIKSVALCFQTRGPDLIISPVILNEGKGFFGKFQETEFLSLQGVTAGTALSGNGTMCNGANLAFTREAYMKSLSDLHPGHPSGDDIFLLHSLKKNRASCIVWLESAAAIVTAAPSSGYRTFFAQRERWFSKWKLYNDSGTIILGSVTLLAVLSELGLVVPAIFDTRLLITLATIMILKSVPDYLIISNRAAAYGKKHLLRWFIPSQLVYPFYVTGVIIVSLIRAGKISSPSH
jgi:poly-beta-1,6-N-acetyl-D-glucosamine synthase